MGWLLGGSLGTSGSLEWLAPGWLVGLAALAAGLAFLFSQRGERAAWVRVAEGICWVAALTGVVVAIARPVWVEQDGRVEPARVAVLVDGSASMSVLEGGVARGDAVAPLLKDLRADDVDVYHFGDDLVSGPPTDFSLGATDLEAALEVLGDRVAGEKLAGVVLVTDGLDRGFLRRRYLSGENPLPPDLPGPLTIYQVGAADQLRDLAVRSIDAGGYAYIHAPAQIRAELLGVGYEGKSIRADLLKDGAVVRSESVTLDDRGRGEVTFEITPDRAGRFTYMVQVPSYEGDAVPSNNLLPVVVRVVRDRIRVLQVAGAPSWDVKFLRRFLKGDPSVDLVSFFILRTRPDLKRRYRDDELSLIEFPYRDLFSTELQTFDLVVFQNFDYRPYFGRTSSGLLENLRDFVVRDGHAVVMVGGDRSFSLGAYGGTALGDILPVKMSTDPVQPNLQSFQASLTPAGARHPITRLTGDIVENETWWSRLHALDGTNMVGDAHPDAAVLLTHPSLQTSSGAPLPVVAVREAGAGRTMSISADTSWRWSLSEAAVGRGNQAYLRFWKGAMRWLVGDPTTRRVTAETNRENYAIGEEVRLQVGVRDADFAPLAGAEVTVTLAVDGASEEIRAVTGEEGDALIRIDAVRRGAHKVSVTVEDDGAEVGKADTVYAVTMRDPELDEVVPDMGFLMWLAERADGRYYPADAPGPIVRDATAGRTVFDRREVPLWRAPALALWVGLFAGLAWLLRRRNGLR